MRNKVLISVLLAVVTIILYAQVVHFGFLQYDDNDYVIANPHVNSGFSAANVAWAFTNSYASNWHPITWLSHMLDVAIFGMNPGKHHLTNVLFHVANTVLLFLLFAALTGSVWRSGFAAALFAIHPIHVESVAWVAERKDVLSMFFLMLTMLAYLRYCKQKSLTRYILVFLALALGLMAKPMLVTAPILLLIFDYWPLRRADAGWKPLVIEKLPLFALSIASSIITFIVQHQGGSVNSLEALSVGTRVSNAIVTCAAYLDRAALPIRLAAHYPYPHQGVPVANILASLFVIAALSAAAWRTRARHPYLLTGWLWYLISLIPVVGLVQVGSQASADRYTYIPLIGVFVAVAWIIPESLAGRVKQPVKRSKKTKPASPPTVLPVAAAVVLTVLVGLSWVQIGYWRNGMVLFQHAVEVTENNSVGYYHLGGAYDQNGKMEEAVKAYEKAISLNPGYGIARKHLADCLARLGKTGDAIASYEQALKEAPGSPIAHNNLANVLLDQGRVDEALYHFQQAIKLDPNCVEAHTSLGRALFTVGRFIEAEKECHTALKLNPNSSEAHNNLGMVYGQNGRASEAENEFRTAMKLDPRQAEAHYNLGILSQSAGRTDEAIGHYRDAIAINPKFISAHSNLAVALSGKGDFAGAWDEVHACVRSGGRVPPGFLDALSKKMPEPPER